MMGEDFVGKVGESDIIKIPVKDPRISSNDAKYINVIFDFTDFFPPFEAPTTDLRRRGILYLHINMHRHTR